MGIGNLPDGWTLSTLGEIADLIGGGTPSREHPEYFTGNHVWLTPTEIPHNRVTVVSTSREKITDEGLKKEFSASFAKRHCVDDITCQHWLCCYCWNRSDN